MNFDHFLLGLLGAAVAVYIFKQQAIPEFRPLFDSTDQVKEAIELRERIKRRRDRLDASGEGARDDQLSGYTARLAELEKTIRMSQIVSRLLGVLLYVGLGGVVAGLLTDSIDVEGVSNNFEAVAIGATWTSYLAGLGLRSEIGKVADIKADVKDRLEATPQSFEQATAQVQQTVREAANAQPGVDTADKAASDVREVLNKVKSQAQANLAAVLAK
jgi:hypothetical protein